MTESANVFEVFSGIQGEGIAVGQRHLFGARAISQGGIEEHNCEAMAFAEVDGQGQLVGPPLVVPSELTAELISLNSVRVGFSCYATAGRVMPSSFEILTDNGTGTLDLQTPADTVPVVDAAQTQYAMTICVGSLPCMFAVRPRLGDASGWRTGAVTVRPASEVNPPELL